MKTYTPTLEFTDEHVRKESTGLIRMPNVLEGFRGVLAYVRRVEFSGECQDTSFILTGLCQNHLISSRVL